MNRRDFLCASATGGLAMFFPYAHANGLHIKEAINKSGRQRMLSQRMAKAYLQIGEGVDLSRSNRIFSASITLFESQLDELENFAPSAENKATLADLRTVWGPYKNILLVRTPNKKDAQTVMQLSDAVLAQAQTATVQLEKISGAPSARLVNISGRQRMLSQRLAKFYQAINWGLLVPDALQKLVSARDEFLGAMIELDKASLNTTAIKRELALAEQQWFFFDQALKSQTVDPEDRLRAATDVATTSERILETMNRITGMYEKLV